MIKMYPRPQYLRLSNLSVALFSALCFQANPMSAKAQLLRYEITTIGSSEFRASSMNDLRQVVGSATIAGQRNAYVWDNVQGQQLIPGLSSGDFHSGHDINNRGEVVGETRNSRGETRAFLWDSTNGTRDLAAAYGVTTSAQTSAYDINNNGVATGRISGIARQPAVIWHPVTGLQELDTFYPNAPSYGNAINDAGQVVGNAYYTNLPGDIDHQGFYWDSINGFVGAGLLGAGTNSFLLDVNNN